MNTAARLIECQPALGNPILEIFPIPAWPGMPDFRSCVHSLPKNWPDFLTRWPEYPGPNYTASIISGRVLGDLLEAGLADGDFVPLNMSEAPIQYFAFRPRAMITMRKVDVSAKMGVTEPAFASAPSYEDYGGHAFALGVSGEKKDEGPIVCIPEVLALARANKWTGISLDAFDGSPRYECNYRGKITREDLSSRPSIIDDYYVAQDVIAADLIRARELAAELQNSPDTPEWTRRSFEMVRKALAEAPHTLGYPMPESARPRRVTKPDAPLIDPKALKRLKLEGDGELQGEIELGRPLFGSDSLSVIVSDEVCDDDVPEVSFTKAEMKRRAKAVLEKLESRLPALEAAIDQLASADETSPADFRATLHDPGVFLDTLDMAEGERWTFTLKDELVAHHFEFDGDSVIEIWAGD